MKQYKLLTRKEKKRAKKLYSFFSSLSNSLNKDRKTKSNDMIFLICIFVSNFQEI